MASFLDKARPVQGSGAPAPTTQPPAQPSVSFASKIRPVATSTPPVEDPNKVKGGIVGDILTGNTQRFGKTIGEAVAAPKNAEMFSEALAGHTKLANDLNKRIKEKRERGEDTSRLERALDEYVKDTPKLEDFTGDVINKTTGQVLGEAAGTALEIAPFGTYGKATKGMKAGQLAPKVTAAPTAVKATKELLTKPSKFLTKEGAKQAAEGAAFGYGVDVTQGLQEKEGAGAFKPGIGTAIGAVAPALVKGAGIGAKAATSKVKDVIANRAAKAAGEIDHLIGTIIQGEAKDLPAARRAFSQIDTEGIKTYSGLKEALNAKIKTGSEKLREALGFEPYVKPLDELTITSKVGDVDVSRNFVDDAISQLDDFYTKTGNYEDAARMQALKQKAAREGITVQEINDLAIRHGQDLSGFSPATGELASGLKKQLAENTRKGLKQTAREQFKSKVYDETDAALSDLIKTRDLITDMEEKVLKVQQQTRDSTLREKLGAALEQILNFSTFGVSRGFLQSGRDLGLFKAKTSMNALEIQELINKSLKRLDDIIDTPANQMESKLDAFLKEAKPQKINKKTLPAKPAKIVKKKSEKGMTNISTLAAGALGLGAATALMTPSTTEYKAPVAEIEQVVAPTSTPKKLAAKPQPLKKATSTTTADLVIDNKPVSVDLKDFPFIDPKFIKVLVDQESSNGLDKRHENLSHGKFGYLVGFTKPTYEDIVKQAKTSERYKNLLAKLNFDTPEAAIKSAAAFANHLMRDFGESGNLKDGSTPKDIDLVELYRRYNGGGSDLGVELFEKKLKTLTQ